MTNTHEEMIKLRGLAGHIQAMNYPSLDSLQGIFELMGFSLFKTEKLIFYAFGKEFSTHSEAFRYASMKIIKENATNKPQDVITISFKEKIF